MNLSTTVSIPKTEKIISATSNLFLIGSCFSENIGEKLSESNFRACINPFGTVFNPFSLSKLLDISSEKTTYEQSGIDTLDGRYFHYDFHSSLDGKSLDELRSNLNRSCHQAQKKLKTSDIVIITFGSSIVYHHTEIDKIVSNCHKVPGKYFDREILSSDEMVDQMNQTIINLQENNPNVNIILTVSPVRHTKEGLIDNSLSKARLVDLCHQLQNNIEGLFYFPSYEIMIDELRDYRYYDSDLIHPSKLAVDIIWERFTNQYFQESAVEKVKDFAKLNKAVYHRPFDNESDGYRQFCKKQLVEISILEKKYPDVDLRMYRDSFSVYL